MCAMYSLFGMLVGIPVVTTFIIHFLEFCVGLVYRKFCYKIEKTVLEQYTVQIQELLQEYHNKLQVHTSEKYTQTELELVDR